MNPELRIRPVSVDYPEHALNRVSTFFRLFLVIPIAIVIPHRGGGYAYGGVGRRGYRRCRLGRAADAAADPVSPEVPRWWFDWNLS